MRKTVSVGMMVVALLGGSAAVAGSASAGPPKSKCDTNAENFQRLTDGRCVSDGRAEKLT